MKKSKLFKVLILILIFITFIAFFSQNSFASTSFVGNIDTKFNGTGDKSEASTKLYELASKIVNFIQVIGAGFALFMLIVLAIKWIYSSPSGKAELSKDIRYYILGVIFIFAAIGLLEIIKKFAINASNSV